MGKLLLIGALTLGLAAPAALAKPVSISTARHAIISDRAAYPEGGVRVSWCHRKHLGTLCQASNGGSCFEDAILGPATLVGTTTWWVSRTRGELSDVPVSQESFAVVPGCAH